MNPDNPSTSLALRFPSALQPAPDAPAAKPPAGDRLKEWVAALLSTSIVACMLILLCIMFVEPNWIDPAAWQHQSSMLQIVVGFAGTATGYYFGRIPAEKAAATAQQAASTAQASLASTSALAQHASESEQRMRTQVGDLRDHYATPLGGGAEGPADPARATVAYHLDQILRS